MRRNWALPVSRPRRTCSPRPERRKDAPNWNRPPASPALSSLKWVNHADLMRINGIGGQYAELLEEAGVDTVKELRTRNAANLAAKLSEANEKRKLTGNVPSESMVTKWIEEAKGMEPGVSY